MLVWEKHCTAHAGVFSCVRYSSVTDSSEKHYDSCHSVSFPFTMHQKHLIRAALHKKMFCRVENILVISSFNFHVCDKLNTSHLCEHFEGIC